MKLNEQGFRIYCEETDIRIGDVVCLSTEANVAPHMPFRAMIVSGVEETLNGNVWTVSRPHCHLTSYSGKESDAQPAVQFERLTFSEEEFRKKLVAFVTGPSGKIDNRNYNPFRPKGR